MNLITVEDFYDKPCHLYVKDFNGVLQESNDRQAIRAGFTKGTDLIGTKDRELAFNLQDARVWQENEKIIAQTQKAQIFLEPSMNLVQGQRIQLKSLSYKTPIIHPLENALVCSDFLFCLRMYDSSMPGMTIPCLSPYYL